MKYEASTLAIMIFLFIVALVLFISFYYSRKGKNSDDYYKAGGNIHWGVNGVAFAGDYLSAASFLGICGMISIAGYDGFLYSIGYLAGWIVALFVVAEPMKKLGKYTFTDALDSKFNSKGIQFFAALSTLIVSMFYLIPQMVGAGSLVEPLLGIPYWGGVLIVGTIVIIIVATAGMASTTYVQFLKGGLLIVFSVIITIMILNNGISTDPDNNFQNYHDFVELPITEINGDVITLEDSSYTIGTSFKTETYWFVKIMIDSKETIWEVDQENNVLKETLFITNKANGDTYYNGAPREDAQFYLVGHMSEVNGSETGDTGSVGVFEFIEQIKEGTVVLWSTKVVHDGDDIITIYYQHEVPGSEVLAPGLKFKVDTDKGATIFDQLDFISLMLALFLGTAGLPHILIRYYTVASPAAARKSTIVAIFAIGFFYLLTMFMGLGAMVNGAIDLSNSNMSAPLLARGFGIWIFAMISAIAFATVLGTVSGLIVASSGAVAHDVMDRFMGIKMTDKQKVMAGKISAIVVGVIAMALGILFKGMNVSYLVGWAFSVAASANLPAIIMVLFWKKTTAKGVVASISVGLISSMTIILLSQSVYTGVYHLVDVTAPMPINNPAIISVPLSFLAIIIVSLLTKKKPTELQT
ncbi:MAG: cation acetate symporter [Firmicutes bacterium]|nr:cation acetate symporter [Bacillota bacterium]